MLHVRRTIHCVVIALAAALTPMLAMPVLAETGTVSFRIAKAGIIVGVGGAATARSSFEVAGIARRPL